MALESHKNVSVMPAGHVLQSLDRFQTAVLILQIAILQPECRLLTVTDGVFPLVLCLYYVCITLTFSISVFKLWFVSFQ